MILRFPEIQPVRWNMKDEGFTITWFPLHFLYFCTIKWNHYLDLHHGSHKLGLNNNSQCPFAVNYLFLHIRRHLCQSGSELRMWMFFYILCSQKIIWWHRSTGSNYFQFISTTMQFCYKLSESSISGPTVLHFLRLGYDCFLVWPYYGSLIIKLNNRFMIGHRVICVIAAEQMCVSSQRINRYSAESAQNIWPAYKFTSSLANKSHLTINRL